MTPRASLLAVWSSAACLLCAPFRLAALEAYLQPEIARQGDIVDLILQYESEIPSLYALDTAALEADFEIIDTQSRIQRLSGHQRQRLRMEWSVKIAPRKTGLLEIPPLQLGDMRSRPLRLEVRALSEADLRRVNVQLEMTAAPEHPYPGQQVIVSLRLLTNTPLGQGRLAEPVVDGGGIFRSGAERRWVERRDDLTLDVLERNISLFADRPGTLLVGPAMYTGFLAEPAERQIIRRSRPIELQVRPLPSDAAGRLWLPAAAFESRLSWDDRAEEVAVGDSVGLDLTLTAHGLPAESLPVDLLRQTHPQFRIYADAARLGNRFEAGSIVGRLQQSFVFVASQPGAISVPETLLTWWDTGANRWREARLPGRQLNISETVSAVEIADPRTREAQPRRGSAPVGSGLLAAVLAALVLLAWFKSKSGRRLRTGLAGLRERRASEQSLREACRLNDPNAARAALQNWAEKRWPDEKVYGLRGIGARLGDAGLDIELAKLDAGLYAGLSAPWRGQALWRRFSASRRRLAAIEPAQASVLPRLYPDQPPDSSRDQPLTGSNRSP